MKRFTKLFLLSICTWFLFLWFSNAQDWIKQDSNTDELNVNTNFESKNWDKRDKSYNPEVYDIGNSCHYQCWINLLWFFTQKFLIWIWILLWIMLVILCIKAIILCKKSNNTFRNNWLFYIPILNLYPISKITVGSVRFFCLILMLWFFIYSLYNDIDKNGCCFDSPSWQSYAWIIIWILSIILLWILLSELSYLINSYKESSKKESPNE